MLLLSLHSERAKRWRKQKEAKGLCNVCGKRPVEQGKRCLICVGRKNASWRRTKDKNRQAVLEAYGNACACCGETEPLFLTIDHVDNDGAEHRRSLGLRPGWQFHRWLVQQGFPEGFQLLCSNCNLGKHLNGGSCPHAEGGVRLVGGVTPDPPF